MSAPPEAGAAQGVARARGFWERLPLGAELWALVALALLLAFNLLFTPGFFEVGLRDGRLYGSLVDVLNRGAPVALLALGMALVIATGGIDLSVGATMAIAGAVAACLVAHPASSVLAGVDVGGSGLAIAGVALLCAMAVGLWNGALVGWLGIQPIVATLILMVAGRGVAQLVTAGEIVTFQHPRLHALGAGSFLGLPVPIHVVLLSYAAAFLLARGTALGLFIEAVGGNARAARLSGINARSIKVAVYVVSGFCAGLAGLLVTTDIQAADANNAGLYLELDAILAVALGGAALTGGRFLLAGTLLGAVLIQALTTTILAHGVPPSFTLVLKAIVVVLVCLLHSGRFRDMARGALRRGAAR